MRALRAKMFAMVLLAIFMAAQFLFLPLYFNYGHKVAFVLFVLYDAALCVVGTFSARVQREEESVTVEQFGVHNLSFEDLLYGAVVPFFPQTFVLVRTKRRFPLNILCCPLQVDVESGGKVERVMLVDFLASHGVKVKGRFWIAPVMLRK